MAAIYTSRFSAVVHSRCPQCRVGKVFTGKAYGLHQRINEICPYCGLRFEIEPGYFYAAMYISYLMVVLEMLAAAIGTYIVTHSESPWLYTGVLIVVILLLAPFNFRYSRLLLLHYLTPGVTFRPEYQEQL